MICLENVDTIELDCFTWRAGGALPTFGVGENLDFMEGDTTPLASAWRFTGVGVLRSLLSLVRPGLSISVIIPIIPRLEGVGAYMWSGRLVADDPGGGVGGGGSVVNIISTGPLANPAIVLP